MSKKYILLFTALIIGLLTACGTTKDDVTTGNRNDSTIVYFTGTIKEINEQVAIVHGEIGGTMYDVFVDLAVNTKENFNVGDNVKVGYNGTILESHPAQIDTLSVELVK